MRTQGPSRSRWLAVGTAVALSAGAALVGSQQFASADVSDGDRAVFIPITPCRLLDTRAAAPIGAKDTPFGPSQQVTLTAHGSNGNCTGASAIPVDATALSLNVTAINQTSRTFVTVWGEGDRPATSNLNPDVGQPPTPNAVNTPLSETGTFEVFNNAGEVNLFIDVNGYYAPHDHDDRYYTEAETDAAIEAGVEAGITPLDNRFYTQAQVDAAIAAATAPETTRSLQFLATDFTLSGTASLTIGGGQQALLFMGDGGEGCAAVNIDMRDVATVDSVTTYTNSDSGAILDVAGQAGGIEADGGGTWVVDTGGVPASADTNEGFAAIDWTINNATVDSTLSHSLIVCAYDEVELLAVEIELTLA